MEKSGGKQDNLLTFLGSVQMAIEVRITPTDPLDIEDRTTDCQPRIFFITDKGI
jgi:hypothetical protein